MKHSQTILTAVLYCDWLNSQQKVKIFVSPQYDSTKECRKKANGLSLIPILIFRRIQRTFIQDNMFNRLTSKQIPARERETIWKEYKGILSRNRIFRLLAAAGSLVSLYFLSCQFLVVLSPMQSKLSTCSCCSFVRHFFIYYAANGTVSLFSLVIFAVNSLYVISIFYFFCFFHEQIGLKYYSLRITN